jgi:uncharacterized membrane protein YdbT with pleckstrin-like domain
MLFITYWEINPDFDPSEIAAAAQELMSRKVYPAKGVNDIVFHVSTSDFWGITLTEAESEEAMIRSTNMWRIAKPGLLKLVKTSPAVEVAKALPILMKLKKEIKG